MDQFAEQISKLADLGDDELSSLEQELVAAFDAADQGGDVETMSSLAEYIDQVRAEIQRRAGAAPDAAAEAAPAAAAPVTELAASAATAEAPAEAAPETTEAPAPAPAAETAEVTPEVTPEAEATETETETPEVTEAVTEETPEATETNPEETAEADDSTTIESAPEEAQQEEDMGAELDAADVADDHKPESVVPATVIRAGGDIPGFSAGAELSGMDEVIGAMTSKINAVRNLSGGSGEKVVVASFRTEVEEGDLTLIPGDPEGNARKIRAVMSDPEAITAAANGWCAPRTPRYEVYGVGSTDRPVRDSLPGFNADRGGIVYTTPPTLAYPTDDGVGTWTFIDDAWEAEDVPGGTSHGTTKVIHEVDCGNEATADTYGITTQLKFSNMMARAYPEWVRRNTELAMIAQARTAETVLLTKMFGLASDIPVDPTPSLGVARDLLVVLRGVVASYRNRHRMGLNDTISIWAPAWLRDAAALDVALQAPGDQITNAVAEVEGYLSDANIDVTWFLDDVVGANQLFTSDVEFPSNASILIASPGTFLYLDNGTLDLGVVRDGDLVAANKYIEFAETFEGVANIGVEASKVSLPVNLIGGKAALVDTSDGIVVAGS